MPTYRPRLFFYSSVIRSAAVFFLSLFLSTIFSVGAQAALPNNPVPFVDIVSPVSIPPGSTGVTITIRGTGFVAGSVVHWNGTALTTTVVGAKELTAAVPDAFVAAVGLGTITVVSPAAGGGSSNVFYIPVASTLVGTNFPATPSSSITVGSNPTGLATGDFNGDGKIDFAVANSGSDTVSILLGNGDGTFTAGTPVAVGTGPHWLVTGDFNEDGKLDLAVANTTSATVSILLGNGDGTFTLHSSPSTGTSPFAVAAGDFNADGHLDLAVTNAGATSVSILLGNGDGTFTAGTSPTVGSTPQVLVVGDFNEDGILDIAVANENSNTVSMLLGVGDGTFHAQTTTAVGGSGTPIGLIAGDFNGDAHLDVAAVDASDVAILLGNGAGLLSLNANPSAGSNLISGVTGDYNGDGKLDIVVADQTAGEAFLFPGNGDGTFGASVTFTTASGTYSAATADFNGDGALDLAFTNKGAASVSIFLQTLPVSLSPASVSFGNQALGTLSSATVVTLTNNTGSTVNISSIAIGGANAADFPKTTTCAATVAGSGTCTISLQFMPTILGPEIATLSVTDDAGNSPQTLALSGTGVVSPQVIAKAFGVAAVPLNGSTSLSFTITNPNTASSLTSVAFTDTLPAGLIVATPNGLTGSCGGGTITATAGSASISLAGATLAASGSCTFSVNVAGVTAGVKNNSVTSTSTEGGAGNTSSASLTVVAPPVLAKSFGAASVPLNGSTSLGFTVTNANAGSALTGITFTDTFPAGLVISTPNGLTGTCGGGTITATQATNSVSLSGASIAASASCTFSVNVTGTAAGTSNNLTGTVTSTEGGTGGNASASIKVVAPPAIVKVFNPTAVALNATTSLIFTITNPTANTAALAGVAFTDTLPTGLTIATSSATVCGGTLTTTAPTTINFSGATLAITGQCQFSVTVTGSASGNYTNVTGNVSATNGGTGNTATANLAVATPPTISKAFGAATLPLNGSTSLTFTVTNPAANGISLTNLSFTDALPAGLVVATPNGLSSTCTGTATATAGASAMSLSGTTLAPNTSCTISGNVTGTAVGVKNNSVTITSAEAGAGNTSNASVTVAGPPTIAAAFGAASIPLNGSTSLSFTIDNTNTTSTLAGIGFSDTLPAGLIISTPNGLTGSCGGGTIAAAQATNVITLSAASLAASGSCTFGVNVTGTAAGAKNDMTGNVMSTTGGTGTDATASLAVVAPPTIAKAFAPVAIAINANSALTITVTNPTANTVALTGVSFTDTLPAGLIVATPNALTSTCGGTATAAAGSASVSLAAGTIAASANCAVTVNATGSSAGIFTNTTGAVSSTNGGAGNTAAANLSVAAMPTITKAFGAAAIPLNGWTSLSFTIINPNSAVSLSGVAFVDNLPAGLVVSTPNGTTGTCGASTIVATAGSGGVSLAGGTLAASASCTFSVSTTGTTVGAKANTTGAVSAIESGAGTVSNTATVTVLTPPSISKTFGAASIALSSSTSLTFIINNPDASAALTGVAVTDNLPTGLVVSTPNGLTGTCGAGTITAAAGATGIALSGGTIAANGSCTFAVNVTGAAGGAQVNTTGPVSSTNGGTGNTATASITVLPPDLVISKSHAGNFTQGQTGASYTITISNTGSAPTSGMVTVTDALPVGMTATAISGTGWTCTLSSLICTRSDVLAAAAAYPVLGLTVSVSGTAQTSLTNNVTVSGGGEINTANDSASDVTTINVVPPDFSVSAAPTTKTIKSGANASFVFTLTPLNDVPFPSAITLTAIGVPPNATILLEPTTVTPGSTAVTDTLIVRTSGGDPFLARNGDQNRNRHDGLRSAVFFAVGLPFAGVFLVGFSFRKKMSLRGKSRVWAIFLVVCVGFALYGCAGQPKALETPAGDYTLTITATSGAVQHSTTVTLTVTP